MHLTASGREHVGVKIVAAALLPPIAVTLYLTFSRGAIWVLPLGFVLYVLLAQPRGLLTGLPAAGIPAALAVKIAYGNELLARADYDSSAAAASQGRHVFLVVLACAAGAAALRAAALPLDRRLEAIEIEEDNRRFLRLALSGGLVIALLLGALAADAPRRLSDARATFSEGRYMDYSDDLRTRLTSAVDNGRIDNWRVALDGFDTSPLHGTGAGTYRITWDADRPAPPIKVNDGHSLYLEVLSELGVVGLVLLLVALGTPLVVGAARLGGPERHAHGAFLAAGLMLLAHAAIDWDWEMPALFVWFFGAAGVVLAAREGRLGELGRTPRIVAALAVLVLAAHACAVRDLAGRAGPRRERVRAARLRRRDRRRADRHRALRRAPGAVDGARLLRRAAGPVRARPARDGRRPLARPGQLAVRLRPGDRLRRLGRRSAAVRARPLCASTRSIRWPVRSCATCGPRRRRPAGARSRGGPGFRWSELLWSASACEGTRPPASSARPPSRTGMAAKPVKGSSLVWAAAACWRSACVSSAGSVPPPPVVGAVPPPPLSESLAGAFSSSAGRTPPSPQMSEGVTVPLPWSA